MTGDKHDPIGATSALSLIMPAGSSPSRHRMLGAVGALVLQALLGTLLFLGLAPGSVTRPIEPMLTYISPPAIAPPKPKPPPARTRTPRGAAAPPAKRATPTPVVAPPPIIPIFAPPPPTIVAAPVAGPGAQATAGAAEQGAGTGAGGEGSGTGSGDAGDGPGDGGTPSVWIRGRIRDSDYPRDAAVALQSGRLVARYLVGANGRVLDCTIVESSGSAVLDGATCRLVRERYRYRPARDAAGRAVPETVFQEHEWVIEAAPPAG